MIRRPPRSTQSRSSAASDVYKRQTQQEIKDAVAKVLKPEVFARTYSNVFEGPERWRTMPVPPGELYAWEAASTYVHEPPFFEDLSMEAAAKGDIAGARVLASLGDSVTTDHIAPAGSIPADGPAGRFLIEKGVQPFEFNSFGARRGNHEVMIRGTFGNIRLRNQLVPGKEGPWTCL